MSVAIKFENVSKQYRLGEVGTGTLSHDLHRAWARMRGKPDPFAKVGQINNRTVKSSVVSRQSSATAEAGPANCQQPTDDTSNYVWAHKDIDFEVEQGEIFGIIGRNGAGKSTLLKLLSRITAPTTGHIKAKGRIASLLEVGTGFHPELTGRENIYLNGAILGMRRHEITKQLDEIVDFSGCAKYIDTPVKRYSSGMTVRLGFAVAAHLNCEILVVDEVLAVGDAEFQKKCIGKMQEVSTTSGKTVLFVSHNMGSVSNLCQTCCVIENGLLAFIGSVPNAISRYLRTTESLTSEFDQSQSDIFSFESVSTLNCYGNRTDVFQSDEEICVTIKYNQREPIAGLELGVSVSSQHGTKVFTTERSHLEKSRLDIGRHSSTVTIPKAFLASGRYTIDIAAYIPNQRMFQLYEQALGFEIEDIGSAFSRYKHRDHGLVFCDCKWETQLGDELENNGQNCDATPQ